MSVHGWVLCYDWCFYYNGFTQIDRFGFNGIFSTNRHISRLNDLNSLEYLCDRRDWVTNPVCWWACFVAMVCSCWFFDIAHSSRTLSSVHSKRSGGWQPGWSAAAWSTESFGRFAEAVCRDTPRSAWLRFHSASDPRLLRRLGVLHAASSCCGENSFAVAVLLPDSLKFSG